MGAEPEPIKYELTKISVKPALFPPLFIIPASGYPGSRHPGIYCSPVEAACILDFGRGKMAPVAFTYIVPPHKALREFNKPCITFTEVHKHVFTFSLKPN